MKSILLLIAATALASCASQTDAIRTNLRAKYVGQNIDALVLRFGAPTSVTPLNSGGKLYEFSAGTQTVMKGDSAVASAETFECRISAQTSNDGTIQAIKTLDAENLLGMSLCGKKVGLDV